MSVLKIVTITPEFLLLCTDRDSFRFLLRARLIGTMALIVGTNRPIASACKIALVDGIGAAVYSNEVVVVKL